MRLLFVLLALIGVARVVPASLVVTPGYGEYAAGGLITRDYFFGDTFPGGEILDYFIRLHGAPTTPVSGPRTNAILFLSFIDYPTPSLVVGTARGCCGMTVRFPERIEMENDEIRVNPIEFVDLHLTGSMNVDAGGELRVWDIDVRLVEPTFLEVLTTGVQDEMAVLFPVGVLPLHYEITERGGPGRVSRTEPFSIPPSDPNYLTTIPEPGSVSLLLIGGVALGLLHFYRSKRGYFFSSPSSRSSRLAKGPA